MAATVSAWSKPGAWALDSEEHEDELIQQSVAAAVAVASTKKNDTSDFPSLAAAASTKTKKKKAQTLSLSEFYTVDQKKFQAGGAAAKGLTVDEQLMLPTGPRQRSAEEMEQSRGFRSYGSSDNRSDSSSKWGAEGAGGRRQGGGFERDRESNRDVVAPSRADETDDWGAAKKSSLIRGGGFERRERGEKGGFFSDSLSRADDSDNWVSNKSFTPSTRGFDRERRSGGGFESNGNGHGGANSDSWGRKREDDGRRGGNEINGGANSDSWGRKREDDGRRGGNEMNGGGAADVENWGKRREDGSGSGSGRPKLNLQPRKLPVGDIEAAPVAAKSSKGSNPFGDARPREQVLKEKGQDWKEIDEKLESTKIKETDGPAFGRRGFGNGRAAIEERTWRKNDNVNSRPSSAQNSENGVTEEKEAREPEI